MNGSYVESDDTTITINLDAINDAYNQLNSLKNEYNSMYMALTSTCNTDFFGTLKNCPQFNTSSFDEYDKQVNSIDECIGSILNGINNYIGNQTEADTINSNELDSIEEVVEESGSEKSSEEPAKPADNTVKETSLDSETIETNEQDKKELKTEEGGEEKTLRTVKTSRELTKQEYDDRGSVKEQERLQDITNQAGSEKEIDNYTENNTALEDITKAPTQEAKKLDINTMPLVEIQQMAFDKMTDSEYNSFVDNLIKQANSNGITVDELLTDINYAQKVKDMCISCDMRDELKFLVTKGNTNDIQSSLNSSLMIGPKSSQNLKNSIASYASQKYGGSVNNLSVQDMRTIITNNYSNGDSKSEAYLKLLSNCSDNYIISKFSNIM